MSSRIDHFLESLWNDLRVIVLSMLTRFSCQSGNLDLLVFRHEIFGAAAGDSVAESI